MSRTPLLGLLLALLLTAGTFAADLADPAQWTPGGWTVYVELRDPDALSRKIEELKLAQRFAATPLGLALKVGQHLRNAGAMRDQIRQGAGIDILQSLRDSFGDAVAFAADAGAAGDPWLVALRSKPPHAPGNLPYMFWQNDRDEGKILNFEEKPVGDRIVMVSFARQNGKKERHVLHERLFVTSQNEQALTLAVDAAQGRKPALAAAPGFADVRKGFADATLFAYVDIHSILLKGQRAKPVVNPYEKAFCDGMAKSVAAAGRLGDKEFSLDATLTLDPEATPTAIASMLADKAPTRSAIARAFPDGKTAARLVLHLPLNRIVDLIRLGLGERERADFEKGVRVVRNALGGLTEEEVSSRIGPEIGVVALPTAADMERVPPMALLLRVTDDATFRGRLLGMIDGLCSVAIEAAAPHLGAAPATLAYREHKGIRYAAISVRPDTQKLPRGLEPCYTISGDFLIAATSPDAMAVALDLAAAAPDTEADAPVLTVDAQQGLNVVAAWARSVTKDAAARQKGEQRVALIRSALTPVEKIVLDGDATAEALRLALTIKADLTRWPLPAGVQQ